MKSLIFLCAAVIMLNGCSDTVNGTKYDLKGYETESISGNAQFATYRDQNGFLIAKGQVLDGVRTGTWVTYHDQSNKIKTITNYINGIKNGIQVTLNDRGQIESSTEYKNDVLHGMTVTYKFGRPIEETSYKDGVLDGPFAIYNNGKIQRRGAFKDGKQHGTLEYFDDKGNLTLKYEYKDGEKISGGIVKPEPASE